MRKETIYATVHCITALANAHFILPVFFFLWLQMLIYMAYKEDKNHK